MNSLQKSMPDDAPIFLVGFMGAGKTTVGRALARYLEYDFCDLDELIAERIGKSVPVIFSELGEAEFRKLESDAIRACRRMVHAVVALGGGAYVQEENRTLLRAIGKTVWLDCPLEVCLERIGGDESRPLLGDEDEMRALLARRCAAYAQANFAVQAGQLSPEQLAIEIATLLSK
jgi:shikimate kinase